MIGTAREDDMGDDTSRQGSEKTVLLIGGTGKLGGLIAQELLARGAQLRLLVRPGSQAKLAAPVAAAVEIVQEERRAFEGVHTVVSAVQGGPDTIIEAQLRFFRAARDAGVRRFIPSDYSFNLYGLAEGENIGSDVRREFARRARAERAAVELVSVLCGCFLDPGVLLGFLPAISLEKGEAYLWGDGSAQMDFTTYQDAAAYTAEAALDERALPESFNVAGDVLTFHELVREVEAGLGRPISVKQLGTLADLDAEIARRQQAEPHNIFTWLPLMYWRAMVGGKGKLGPLMNAQYPDIQPTRVREYLERMATQ
jgi:nucleoside-diphosphate-sugar epimerase